MRRREEQEEKEWIGPGKVLLLCGGVRGRGAKRTFDRGKILVRGYSVLASRTVQVASPAALLGYGGARWEEPLGTRDG